MTRYIQKIPHSVVYSIGDTHGRGREVIEFIAKLEMRSYLRGETNPAFVQLGDLCDGFAMPEDSSPENLRAISLARIENIPRLREVLFHEGNRFVDWQKDLGVRGLLTADELINHEDPTVITAFYEACKCFETLLLYSHYQKAHPDNFFVIFGNHDADFLRGKCAYGRQQKYILFGLLGLSANAVIAHMTEGKTRRVLRNPWANWMNRRPHLLFSGDTLYMHGGPTGELAQTLAQTGTEGFRQWIAEIDKARGRGMNDPIFEEHASFLSPDGAPNDWFRFPERILDFLKAAQCDYLAVGHSPFLDYEKGPMLDLANATPEMKRNFNTPAQLPPEGRLIKHDTNLKRTGELWACRHEVGTNIWTGIDANLNEFPLRT
ncbi:MAG: metallophosphoesterase [Proteobacteria bacterium]|nr:metallophosphoesterase [Pseudomonadota bacterium]